jgi:hypothetical protein
VLDVPLVVAGRAVPVVLGELVSGRLVWVVVLEVVGGPVLPVVMGALVGGRVVPVVEEVVDEEVLVVAGPHAVVAGLELAVASTSSTSSWSSTSSTSSLVAGWTTRAGWWRAGAVTWPRWRRSLSRRSSMALARRRSLAWWRPFCDPFA